MTVDSLADRGMMAEHTMKCKCIYVPGIDMMASRGVLLLTSTSRASFLKIEGYYMMHYSVNTLIFAKDACQRSTNEQDF